MFSALHVLLYAGFVVTIVVLIRRLQVKNFALQNAAGQIGRAIPFTRVFKPGDEFHVLGYTVVGAYRNQYAIIVDPTNSNLVLTIDVTNMWVYDADGAQMNDMPQGMYHYIVKEVHGSEDAPRPELHCRKKFGVQKAA